MPARHSSVMGDARQLAAAVQALHAAREAVTAAQRRLVEALRAVQTAEDLGRQAAALVLRREQGAAHSAAVENEIANWTLLARCMGHDGLVALEIDDAGPALSGLANDLLLACYGPRFTVAIHALLHTGAGEQREGFDIVVHDVTTGEDKSVGLMSGGERLGSKPA